MWFYTADTVTRVTSTRRPIPMPRPARKDAPAAHRLAGALRSLADRVEATGPTRSPATDF